MSTSAHEVLEQAVVSGSASVSMEGINVSLTAAPSAGGTVSCLVTCNGQQVQLDFSQADVDVRVMRE